MFWLTIEGIPRHGCPLSWVPSVRWRSSPQVLLTRVSSTWLARTDKVAHTDRDAHSAGDSTALHRLCVASAKLSQHQSSRLAAIGVELLFAWSHSPDSIGPNVQSSIQRATSLTPKKHIPQYSCPAPQLPTATLIIEPTRSALLTSDSTQPQRFPLSERDRACGRAKCQPRPRAAPLALEAPAVEHAVQVAPDGACAPPPGTQRARCLLECRALPAHYKFISACGNGHVRRCRGHGACYRRMQSAPLLKRPLEG